MTTEFIYYYKLTNYSVNIDYIFRRKYSAGAKFTNYRIKDFILLQFLSTDIFLTEDSSTNLLNDRQTIQKLCLTLFKNKVLQCSM